MIVGVATALVVGGAAAATGVGRWTTAEPRTVVPRPAVGLIGLLLGTAAAWTASSAAELATFAVLALACSLLVATDIACHRLPDAVTAPAAVLLVLGLTLTAATTQDWWDLGRALLAGLAVGTAFVLLALASPRSLGLGDVKLAAVLAVLLGWRGWDTVLVGLVLMFLSAGLVALVAVLLGRADRRTALPFGPFLVGGAWVAAILATDNPWLSG